MHTHTRQAKHLDNDVLARRRELKAEKARLKAEEEDKRRAENRRLQAMLRSAGPRTPRLGPSALTAAGRRGSQSRGAGDARPGPSPRRSRSSMSGTGAPAEKFDSGEDGTARERPPPAPLSLASLGSSGGPGSPKRAKSPYKTRSPKRAQSRDALVSSSGEPVMPARRADSGQGPLVTAAPPATAASRSRTPSDSSRGDQGSSGGGGGPGGRERHLSLSLASGVSQRSPSPRFAPGEEVQWRKVELIGKGATGRVYSALLVATGQLIAVKQYMTRDDGIDRKAMQVFQMEIEVMEDLSHPNIVQYLGSELGEEDGDSQLNIFLEYIPGHSLASLIEKTGGALDEGIAKMYLRQILLGTSYLHSNGIVHRDIKGANILISDQGVAKLTDFGASKRLSDDDDTLNGCKTFSGTPFWMAPEVIRNEQYGRKADVWSIGCTLVEMVTGNHPWFPRTNAFAVMFHVTNTNEAPEVPPTLSEACLDFLSLCFDRDPEARPSVDELLEHEFVADDDDTFEL
jgi:hypothetical protein